MIISLTSFKKASNSKNIFFALFLGEKIRNQDIFSELNENIQGQISQFLQTEFKGEEGETKQLWLKEGSDVRRIVFFGLGEEKNWNDRKKHLVARMFIRYAKSNKLEEFAAVNAMQKLANNETEASKVFGLNAVLADFDFNIYKEKPKEGWPEIKTIYLAAINHQDKQVKTGLEQGIIIGEETNGCRRLANIPGGDMTPALLAEAAKNLANKNKLKIKILEEEDMRKLGMGGVLGVAKGSNEKPKFIVMEYFGGPKKQKPLVLVGKGVTFDTGGLNLKPEHGIFEMHMDMSGAASVMHGLAAIKRLNLPINAVAIAPAVENMPSGSSYRPGDILTTMSGKTIEVLNTDAEGRIILSDGLYYGATKYSPGFMIDFATLTGAACVALGLYCSAIFTNKDKIINQLIEAGEQSGDYVWPLPLWDEYFRDIKGTLGDVANLGRVDRAGGAIHGAKFLEQFINGSAWAHIDIAPRMTTNETEYLAKGAAGSGVRYITEIAKNYTQLLNNL